MGAAGPAIALQGAGAATSAYSAYQQGLAQQRYYNYVGANKRQEAAMTLKQGEQESNIAQDEGAYQTGNLNRKVLQTEGSQKVAEAANGVAGSVTAADIQTDTSQKSMLDQMAIRYNADRAGWLAKTNASRKAWALNTEADQEEYAGRAARQAGKIGVANSLLGGAGQVAGTWYRGNATAPSPGVR